MPLPLPWYSACGRAGINERSEWENSGHSPSEASRPHRNQENARTGRQSLTILSSHQAHQGTAISEDTAQRAARRMPRRASRHSLT